MRIELSHEQLLRLWNGEEDLTFRVIPADANPQPPAPLPTPTNEWESLADESLSPGKVWYVSPSASAFGEGTRINPLAFLSAMGMANSGDQIRLLAGTYTEDRILGGSFKVPERLGAPGRWVTVAPDDDAKVTLVGKTYETVLNLTGSYQQAWGFEIVQDYPQMSVSDPWHGGGVSLSGYRDIGPHGAHHQRALGMHVHDCPGGGISTHWSSHHAIAGNLVQRCGYLGPNQPSNLSRWWSIFANVDPNPIDDPMFGYGITDVVYGNRSMESDNKVSNSNGDFTDGNGGIDDLSDWPENEHERYAGEILWAANFFADNGGCGFRSLDSSGVWVLHNEFANNGLRGGSQSPGLAIASWRDPRPGETIHGGNLGELIRLQGEGRGVEINTGLKTGRFNESDNLHSLAALGRVVARELAA